MRRATHVSDPTGETSVLVKMTNSVNQTSSKIFELIYTFYFHLPL